MTSRMYVPPIDPAKIAAPSREIYRLMGEERYGNPMMRARHLRFAITPRAREQWLACFERVLANAPERYGFPAEHLPGFRAFLEDFSQWMVNTEASDHDPGAAIAGAGPRGE